MSHEQRTNLINTKSLKSCLMNVKSLGHAFWTQSHQHMSYEQRTNLIDMRHCLDMPYERKVIRTWFMNMKSSTKYIINTKSLNVMPYEQEVFRDMANDCKVIRICFMNLKSLWACLWRLSHWGQTLWMQSHQGHALWYSVLTRLCVKRNNAEKVKI